METTAVATNGSEQSGIYFTQAANGIWLPRYVKLSEVQVQRGAPVWQSREDRSGWFEVDEGKVDVPESNQSEKNFIQQRQCYKCREKFHWRTMKMRSETVYTSVTARKNAGTSAECEDIKWGRQYTRKWHTCLSCYAYELGMAKHEAKKILIQNRSAKMVTRAEVHKEKRIQKHSSTTSGWTTTYQHGQSNRWNTSECREFEHEGFHPEYPHEISHSRDSELTDFRWGPPDTIADSRCSPSSWRGVAPVGFTSENAMEKDRGVKEWKTQRRHLCGTSEGNDLEVADPTDSRWHSDDVITDSRTEKTYRLGLSDLTDMRWGFRFDSADGITNSTRATSSLREVAPVGYPGDNAKRKRGATLPADAGSNTSKRVTKNSFWRLRITSSHSSSSSAAPLVPQPCREAPPQHMLVGPHVVRPRFLRPRPPRGPPPAHLLRPGAEPCFPRVPEEMMGFPESCSTQSWRDR